MSFILEENQFLIAQHGDRIIEVVYPREPDNAAVTDYTFRIKRVIDSQEGEWKSLVDQTALHVLSPRLADKIRLLNNYAVRKGMVRSARVVSPAAPTLPSHFLVHETTLRDRVRVFRSRADGFAWLRGQLSEGKLPS